jgi:hypothetical protein
MKDTINFVLEALRSQTVFSWLFAAVLIFIIFGCTTIKIEKEPIFIDIDSLRDIPGCDIRLSFFYP